MYLWLILILPLIFLSHFYLFKHSKKKAMKFANFEVMKRVTGRRILTKNIPLLILRLLIVLLAILAVAGAVLWYPGNSNNNEFMLAIDTSASMLTEDIEPTRLEAAKEHAINFVNTLESDTKIGIVTFSGVTQINQIPTRDKELVKKKIEGINIMEAGGTDLPGAIITSTNLLVTSKKGKTIIILSDGSSTIGAYLDDAVTEALEYAQNNHVIIHTIGTGTDEEQPLGYIPEYYNLTSVYNENNLKMISNQTQGKYYQGIDNQKILEAFKAIEDDSERAIISLDLSFGLILTALILLFIEWGLINTRFRRMPK